MSPGTKLPSSVAASRSVKARTVSGPTTGTIVAVCLLVGTGAAYRATASRFERADDAVSLQAGALDSFPLVLGNWTGSNVPLDEAIVKRTDTDAHLNRRYVRHGTRDAVTLFMGAGVRVRDLMPHRPEVCYIGAGWTLDETKRVELAVPDGTSLPCQIHTFYRSGLDAQRIAVLNYYIVDDVYCADVSLLRSKAWRFKAKTAYVAQVQVASRVNRFGGSGDGTVRAFATESALGLRNVLRDAVRQAAASNAE